MQPTLRHVPPNVPISTNATVRWSNLASTIELPGTGADDAEVEMTHSSHRASKSRRYSLGSACRATAESEHHKTVGGISIGGKTEPSSPEPDLLTLRLLWRSSNYAMHAWYVRGHRAW